MLMKAYTIRDSKAETYGLPFFQATHGMAERSFRELVNDPQSKVNKFPEDFDLYYIGEYDDQTGKFEALETPEHQLKAVNIVQQRPVQSPVQLSSH